MNANDKEKLSRILRKIERRAGNHREAAKKMAGSLENVHYYYGARDEADAILKMLQVEFNNELRVVNVVTNGEVL